MTGAGPLPAAQARARGRQVARIERLMLAPTGSLEGLDGVPADDLRALHDQISESYFAPGRDLLARVAGLAKVLPATVAGRFAEKFLPPTQGARAAEMLEPAKARDLCGKVSVRYLAELSLALDPARSRPILRAIPPQRVGEVAAELFRRHEYGAVAELAGGVTREALAAAVEGATGRDLLMVLPMLEWTDDITAVVDRVPAGTVRALLRAMVDDGLWDQGRDVVEQLPARARERLREGVAALSEPQRGRLRAAVAEGALGPDAQALGL